MVSVMALFLPVRCAQCISSDVLENVNPDASDSEFLDTAGNEPQTPGFAESEMGDAPTPGGAEDGEDEDGEEGDIDEDLAAELDLALEEGDEEGDEEEEEEEEESEEEDEDEDDEVVQAKKLLNEEIRDLEAAVAKKNGEIASSANPLIRVSRVLLQTRSAARTDVRISDDSRTR